MARTLVLLRHAKSGYPDGVGDHDRPLTERGRRDAAAAGRLLADRPAPDLVMCSSAVRSRQTWELVEQGLAAPATVHYEPSLYLATPRAMLGLVRGTAAEVSHLVLVAHNPGTQELAVTLAGDGERSALRAIGEKYPTAGMAVLEVPGSWRDLDSGGARLVCFAAPRG